MLFAFFLPPLLGFLLNGFRFKSQNKKLSGGIGLLACALSFFSVLSYCFLYGFKAQSFYLAPWLFVGDLSLSFSFNLDALSLLLSLLITGVGSLIHLFSLSYMAKDVSITRYFAYLNLFVFMMLILVLADTLPLMFIGWEGVGLCSYLLIGFWFKKTEKVEAGWMAFLVNRIGDACFLLGIFLLFSVFGTVEFSKLNALNSSALLPKEFFLSSLGALFLFFGAVGKSAQFPLYFWLPKAMAGPTPVSALIHAATMVTAGVYLVVRLGAFYSLFPQVLLLMAWLGAFTALASALVACRQWDFKKVLAYSTISHLAYLFMALGVGAFSAGVFHLISHGFFKALLFLCAGSVIHALNGEQDIRKMGGLKKSMPITFVCFVIGALALIAMPPFSGFFSKDEILWSLFASKNYGLYVMAFVTGLCSVFYMTRLAVFVFFGAKRSKALAHEGSPAITLPLIVLAFLSTVGGVLGIPHLISQVLPSHPPHLLYELLKEDLFLKTFKGSLMLEFALMLLSVLSGILVLYLTTFYYLKKQKKSPTTYRAYWWKTLLQEAFFVPVFINKYMGPGFKTFTQKLFFRIEQKAFQQGVLFLNSQVFKLKERFSNLQNGNLHSYSFYFVIGLTVFVVLIFLR